MFTTKIKTESKEQFKKSHKFYIKLSSEFFVLLFLSIILPFLLKYIYYLVLYGFINFDLYAISQNIVANVLSNFLYSTLVIIYSYKTYANIIKADKSEYLNNKSLKRIIYFSCIIFLIQLPFFVSLSVISNILLTSGIEGISSISYEFLKLLQIMILLLRMALDILLYFSICAYALNPDKSIRVTIINSFKLIVKNIFSYIVFELSFILWYIIPFILLVVSLGLMGQSLMGIDEKRNVLFISLLTFLYSPFMFGAGLYFFPYYHISKLNFYKKTLNELDPESTVLFSIKLSIKQSKISILCYAHQSGILR